jgi:DNA-binding NarL/FixJ family response regulator
MPLSSIAQWVGLRRDKGHDRTARLFRVLDDFSRSMQKQGEQTPTGEALRVAAKAAAKSRDVLRAPEEAVAQYLSELPEQQRDMLRKWHEGMTTFEIAESMNLQPQAVARSLAKVYANLRVLQRHHGKKAVR